MGLVEMRDDAPLLTNEGHQALAGDLLSNGRGQFDDHDRDYALQGLAAVSPLAASQRCAAQPNASSTRLKAGCCRISP